MIGIVFAFSIAAVFMIFNAINADTQDSDDDDEDRDDDGGGSTEGGWGTPCSYELFQISLITQKSNAIVMIIQIN